MPAASTPTAARSSATPPAACTRLPHTATTSACKAKRSSRLILRQAGQGRDIGDPALLAAYDRRHQLNTRPLYHGTNAIVKLFTRETPPAKILRHGVLRLSQALPPLKHLITRQLTG